MAAPSAHVAPPSSGASLQASEAAQLFAPPKEATKGALSEAEVWQSLRANQASGFYDAKGLAKEMSKWGERGFECPTPDALHKALKSRTRPRAVESAGCDVCVLDLEV